MKVVKAFWVVTSGSVCVAALAFAFMAVIASGSILNEDVKQRMQHADDIEQSRKYVQANCKFVQRVEDPKNHTSIQRSLYRCPAYRMIVI